MFVFDFIDHTYKQVPDKEKIERRKRMKEIMDRSLKELEDRVDEFE